MSAKVHCDNCDATPADSVLENVVDIGEKFHTKFKLIVRIEKQYPDEPEHTARDLCNDCKRRALTKLLSSIGGPLGFLSGDLL